MHYVRVDAGWTTAATGMQKRLALAMVEECITVAQETKDQAES